MFFIEIIFSVIIFLNFLNNQINIEFLDFYFSKLYDFIFKCFLKLNIFLSQKYYILFLN